MMSEDNLVKSFAKSFRLLAKLSTVVDDRFFGNLLEESSVKLLDEYLKFLKGNRVNVAQYHQKLTFQIQNILLSLDIIGYLKLTKSVTPLLLQRELLKLRLILLNFKKPVPSAGVHNGHFINKDKRNAKKNIKLAEISELHKQIAEFIKNKNRPQNTEVFGNFSHISRRTLKRKLSELANAGMIRRSSIGKKVFYVASNVDN